MSPVDKPDKHDPGDGKLPKKKKKGKQIKSDSLMVKLSKYF